MKKDDIVFALFKDEPLGSVNAFRKKIKKYAQTIDVGGTYIKIHNYQVEKYGCSLNNYNETPATRGEGFRKAALARQRKYDKLHRGRGNYYGNIDERL